MYDNYGEICRNLCTCEEKEGILTVSCENRGIIRLTEISPVHFSMYHLLLTGNLLKKLSVNDFINYTGVTILHLGNNDISEIESGAFNGLQGLKRLHLNNNKIEILRDDTFAGLESLEYLQIDYNYITNIESNALSKLHQLTVLILNDNLLSAMPPNIFRNVPLTHLDLRGNRLKMFPYIGLLEHMDKVVELQLEENPWNCSCELIALKAWLESIAYTALVGEVVCETPFRLHGRDLDEVSKQELCPRRPPDDTVRPAPPSSTNGYYQTTPAAVTASATSSAVFRSSSRPTKGTRQFNRTRLKPTSRIPEYNKIKEVDAGTFRYLPNLQLLFLNNNLLKTLPVGIFSSLSLSRLNLRNNYFQNLPVSGVLDQLKLLLQIDLFENPWDCSCDIVGMKIWLEQLSAGTVVNEVVCETPKRHTGMDVRSIQSEQLCPDYSDAYVSPTPPTDEPMDDRVVTTAAPQKFNTPSSTVPLSVLILSLLLVFIMSVFVAAGLFVVVMKKRKKSQSDRTSTNNSDVSSFNLQYSLYSNRSGPKVKAPAGHVYEYIPHPMGHMCKNPIYRSREGNTVEDYRDLHELKVTYRSTPDEERDSSTMRSPTYSVSTIEPRDNASPVQDADHFFRGILEPDKQSPHQSIPSIPAGANLEYKYTGPVSYTYNPNFDVRHAQNENRRHHLGDEEFWNRLQAPKSTTHIPTSFSDVEAGRHGNRAPYASTVAACGVESAETGAVLKELDCALGDRSDNEMIPVGLFVILTNTSKHARTTNTPKEFHREAASLRKTSEHQFTDINSQAAAVVVVATMCSNTKLLSTIVPQELQCLLQTRLNNMLENKMECG
ncbi:hypothetical protein INR49_026073 [Caranx melampygus]|nr:hypothetical protein INR49_026073 [Caranx melampygus]